VTTQLQLIIIIIIYYYNFCQFHSVSVRPGIRFDGGDEERIYVIVTWRCNSTFRQQLNTYIPAEVLSV